MASVLLKFGADVNSKDHVASELSSWEDFLYGYLGELSSPRKRLTNPDFVRVMSLFLSSGADTRICLDDSKNRIDLLEFFEEYVRSKYPTEAECLYDEITAASRLRFRPEGPEPERPELEELELDELELEEPELEEPELEELELAKSEPEETESEESEPEGIRSKVAQVWALLPRFFTSLF